MKNIYYFVHPLKTRNSLSHNLLLSRTILNTDRTPEVNCCREEMKLGSFLFGKRAGSTNLQSRLPLQGL